MEKPGCPMGPAPSRTTPRRRRRQQRTVYSAEQRQELEDFFARKKYPTYQERETLAARLNLQEEQVQVWFKNRRAKHLRLLRRSECREGPEALAALQGPGACPATPAPSGPVFPGGPVTPVTPEGPGFCSPPLPSPFGVFPAAQPSVSSQTQAWWDPGQGAQKMVPAAPAPAPAAAPAAAPAPAPVCPRDPHASDFSPDPVRTHGFNKPPSTQDPSKGPSSSMSECQNGDDFVDEKDLGPRTLLEL